MNTNSRLEEIDFIKGFAIASVILLNTLSAEIRDSLFSIFHIGQAVPIFIATTFFLSFISIQKAEKRILANWYSKKRLYNMLKRIVLPVLVINVLQHDHHTGLPIILTNCRLCFCEFPYKAAPILEHQCLLMSILFLPMCNHNLGTYM